MPANHTAFKPGKTGNPYGRPRRNDCIGDMLRDLLANGKTAKECAEIALRWARSDDGHVAIKALTFIADRTGGKPAQRLILDDAIAEEKDRFLEQIANERLAALIAEAPRDN